MVHWILLILVLCNVIVGRGYAEEEKPLSAEDFEVIENFDILQDLDLLMEDMELIKDLHELGENDE